MWGGGRTHEATVLASDLAQRGPCCEKHFNYLTLSPRGHDGDGAQHEAQNNPPTDDEHTA